jgi:hypothetical protein
MAWAADDGGQRLRRRSGEVQWLGKEMAVGMWVRERKRECIGSSRMCFKLRRGHSEREMVLVAGGVRGGRGRSSDRGGGNVARAGEDSGRTRAAVDRGATRGGCQE